ncbi:hypothetical protein D3Z39_16180 [Anaerotruncus colihominis]|uniref:Uncharacterized protein n=1 Tax=Anaerotruncus colihominis TaxID=169435 RepID=A0A845RL67_9FIRM|nr:hypothetical protein [Anaerotruncus colihominis]
MLSKQAAPRTAARPVFAQRLPRWGAGARDPCAWEGFFQKGRKVGAGKIRASRAASVTDFAGGSLARLNRCLAACGPRFL